MHADWLPRLRSPEALAPYDVDVTRRTGDDIEEAFLVCRETRGVRPLLGGLPFLVEDLREHLRAFGHVIQRMPVADSRMARFVLGRAGRGNDDFVPFDEVSQRYGDLVDPEHVEVVPPMAPADEALARLLRALPASPEPALDLGCRVGRSTFLLREHRPAAMGVDRSAARVRRARNVQATDSAFHVRVAPDADEAPLQIRRLQRDAVDFAVIDDGPLPFADGVFSVVVWRDEDGRGPWGDPERLLNDALRVLAPDGILVAADGGGPGGSPLVAVASEGGLSAWRRP